MAVRLTYPYLPGRLTVRHPLVIQDLIDMLGEGKADCFGEILSMCTDLYQNGEACRYIKAFGGKVYELRSTSRGGAKGGARVYFFRGFHAEFMLVHAECKQGDTANARLLNDLAVVLDAYRRGIPVFP